MTTSTYPYSFPSGGEPMLTLSFEESSALWTLELHNGEDNRLTESFLNKAVKHALDIVEKDWRVRWRKAQAAKDPEGGKGALIIVGKRSQNKFFSNGLDFANVLKDPNFFFETFNPFIVRLITFPIPIVAAINGHAFAGGLLMALSCDYRVMTDGKERRAWTCMNEIDFGANVPVSFISLIQSKIPSPLTVRKILLEGHRFTPQESLSAGIIDYIADGSSTDAVLAMAKEVAMRVSGFAKTGVYGLIKKGTWRETLDVCSQDVRSVTPAHQDAAFLSKL